MNRDHPRHINILPGGGSRLLATYPPRRAILMRYVDRVFDVAGDLPACAEMRSIIAISLAVSAQPGLSLVRALFNIVSQKILYSRMQNMAIRLTRRSATRSFNFSALKPDMRILKNPRSSTSWNTRRFSRSLDRDFRQADRLAVSNRWVSALQTDRHPLQE